MQIIERIKMAIFRYRLRRGLARYFDQCPTGRAFNAALAAAKADNDAWRRQQAARRQ